MLTREKVEAIEDQNLALYAMKSKDTAGREYPEDKCSHRTCYQRDRDRIVHSEAFRKLEYKTQVFVIFEGDYYRTRLTHTIEVAQIARSIGRSLQLNEDLIEAIALAHDLGHSPFGHAGEDVLKELMKGKGGFNHNFHSYEIVSQMEKRYPGFNGLNLSREVLIGILKHETEYDEKGDVKKFEKIGPTFEAKVVDIADALAYLSHDVDDGLTSGCITKEDLMENNLWKKAASTIVDGLETSNIEIFKYQIVRALIDIQIKDLMMASQKRLEACNLNSSQEVKDFNNSNPKEVIIGFSDEMLKEHRHLRSLLHEKFYHHYRVERMTSKAKRILKDLFKVYMENPKQLPYDVYSRDKDYSEREKYKIFCNHIASMTDRSALDEHKKLFNPYQKV